MTVGGSQSDALPPSSEQEVILIKCTKSVSKVIKPDQGNQKTENLVEVGATQDEMENSIKENLVEVGATQDEMENSINMDEGEGDYDDIINMGLNYIDI